MTRRASGLPQLYFFVASLFILGILIVYASLFLPISREDRWKEVLIPAGSTYTEGIRRLKREGVIQHEILFHVLGRITKLEKKLRAGFYNINTSMSAWEVFNRLRKGMIVQYSITIPEGSRLIDILSDLRDKNLIDTRSQQLVRDREFLSSMDIEAPSIEGYLYPETYNFAKGAKPEHIFRMMVNRLRENYTDTLMERADELNMTEREVLTLASIIEHEALYDRERPIISAVYHNRLNKKMRLQADPTVVYGIKRMQEGITKSDLRRKTPYNTYVINGLPPGPISSPGIESIKAALYPADVDFIYFVSKNDGTHYFSKTWKEHLKAVLFYQRRKEPAEKDPETVPVTDTQEEDIPLEPQDADMEESNDKKKADTADNARRT